MDSVEPNLREASVNATRGQLLLPFTILDAMILVAGCAVSAWLLAELRDGLGYFAPSDPRYWLLWIWPIVLGPTIVAPVILKLQYMRGRLEKLSLAELAWLGFAILWLPLPVQLAIGFEWWHNHPVLERLWLWYNLFLTGALPPIGVLVLALVLAFHWRRYRTRPWSHRFGLAVAAAQVVVSSFIVFSLWFQ